MEKTEEAAAPINLPLARPRTRLELLAELGEVKGIKESVQNRRINNTKRKKGMTFR